MDTLLQFLYDLNATGQIENAIIALLIFILIGEVIFIIWSQRRALTRTKLNPKLADAVDQQPQDTLEKQINQQESRKKRVRIVFVALWGVITTFFVVSIALVQEINHQNQLNIDAHTTKTPTASPTPSEHLSDLIGFVIVKSETQDDGSIKNIVDLSINSTGVGEVYLEFPPEMKTGDSGIVRFSIIPNNNVAKSISTTTSTQNSSWYGDPFYFTDTIELYPVMEANLVGAGFEIIDNNSRLKDILSDRPTEWIWSIKATHSGTQILVVQISIPVIVNGSPEFIASPLKNIPMEIRVEKSIGTRLEFLSPLVVPSLIGLIGALLGAYLNNRTAERKKSKKKAVVKK